MINILHNTKIIVASFVVQALTLAGLVTSSPAIETAQYTQTRVVAQSVSEEDQEYMECLAVPLALREFCARQIGLALAEDANMPAEDKAQNCMKLRPVFYSYCLEELR